jgi:RimJ/RimL family protein N-acetyltransferase
MIVRPIRIEEAEAFAALRIEAVRDYPLAFTADHSETAARPPEVWRQQAARSGGDGSELIVLAWGGEQLAGMLGVVAPNSGKLAHVGTIWGVYVRPPFRGRAIGQQMLRAAIDWARARPLATLKLSVVAGNDIAKKCYEQAGFAVYGVEPLAVKWEGKLYDESLMVLRL